MNKIYVFIVIVLEILLVGCTQDNQQIQDLQNQVSNLQNTVNQQNEKIKSLDSSIATKEIDNCIIDKVYKTNNSCICLPKQNGTNYFLSRVEETTCNDEVLNPLRGKVSDEEWTLLLEENCKRDVIGYKCRAEPGPIMNDTLIPPDYEEAR